MTRMTSSFVLVTFGLFAACDAGSMNAPRANSGSAHAGNNDGANDAPEKRVTWREPVEVVSGNATRGPWRMNRSEWDFVDDAASAINDHGITAVAWTDHPKQDIHFQLFTPDGEAVLDEPVNVSRSGRIFSWLPRMILTNADEPDAIEVFVLWQEIVFSGGSHGGEIFFARSSDGGRSFSEPINLSNTTAGAGKGRLTRQSWHNGSLDLARDADGNLHAAWTEYEGRLWYSRSTDGGASFSDPLHVAGDDDVPARGPSVAVDRDGRVHLAWTVGEDASANIQFAVSEDGGSAFTSPRPVHESDGHADAPKILIDGRGTVHMVYAERSGGAGYHLRYTSADAGSQSFEQPREIIRGRDIGAASVNFPMLRLDGQDNLYLTWEVYPSPRGRPRGLGFAFSADGGASFSTPEIIAGSDDADLGFNGSQQGLLASKLAVNGAGDIAVANSTYRQNRSSHIWLFRGSLAE